MLNRVMLVCGMHKCACDGLVAGFFIMICIRRPKSAIGSVDYHISISLEYKTCGCVESILVLGAVIGSPSLPPSFLVHDQVTIVLENKVKLFIGRIHLVVVIRVESGSIHGPHCRVLVLVHDEDVFL